MTYTIGLDADGVLYKWEKTARYMLRLRLTRQGRPIPEGLKHPSVHWNTIQECVSERDWQWLWSDGVDQGLFRYGHGYPGFIEGAQALTALGDVVVITSRPKAAVNDTLAWFGLMFDKVTLSGMRILSHAEAKSSIEPLPNIYIDDAVHNLNDILINTPDYVRAVLFDQPWNQMYEQHDPDMAAPRLPSREARAGRWKRAHGWPEVVDLVRDAKAGSW